MEKKQMQRKKEEKNLGFWIATIFYVVLIFSIIAMSFGGDFRFEIRDGDVFTYFIIAGLAVSYFIPSFIAGSRKHRSGMAIVALNVFLGWTFLGWVGSLIWSLTGNVEEKKG